MIGSTIAHYRLTALLGEGGMGAVYRATDTKLNRDVAIKVLPNPFASDPDRLARFTREAQVLASLNHPNIATIHGIEECAIVMELVEGPTLADRIAKGALNPDEALAVAAQIAAALEAAHDKGIIHRDLKPANIKFASDGTVKVLDFGLAAIAQETAPDPVNSPTVVAVSTAGMILGTPAYMSPEQARGAVVDRRSDIWSFTAVLYEMLTGKAAYQGESVSDILASVLAREPDLALIPAHLRPILERAFRKDARMRWRDIGDLRIALMDAKTAKPEVERTALRLRVSWAWLIPATVALVAAAVAAGWLLARHSAPEQDTRVFQLSVNPPPGIEFVTHNSGGVAISPDGRQIAFVGSGNPPKIWIRPVDGGTAREMPGTDVPRVPFWSPDSRFLGFESKGVLKKMEVAGGSTITLTAAATLRGATWGADGTILYTPSISAGLMKIPSSGGDPVVVTKPDVAAEESSHRWPQFLPDGRRFIYFLLSNKPEDSGVFLSSLDRPEVRTRLTHSQGPGVYVPAQGRWPAYLVWATDGTPRAQKFEAGAGRLIGQSMLLPAEGVNVPTGPFGLAFSVANDGTLVLSGESAAQYKLCWFSRDGKLLSEVGANSYSSFRLSPNGRSLASAIDSTGSRDLWVLDLERRVQTRLTANAQTLMAVWSPNSQDLAYTRLAAGVILQRDASGARAEQTIRRSNQVVYINDWSADGRYWLYEELSPETLGDLWLLPTSGNPTPVLYIRTKGNDSNGQISPDGRWAAYVSDESGSDQVYIQSFPVAGRKWQVSSRGGNFPRWRGDGKELFYREPEGNLMSVSVRAATDAMELGTPAVLFRTLPPLGRHNYNYDVSSDGQRILSLAPAMQRTIVPLTVLMNWQAGLKH